MPAKGERASLSCGALCPAGGLQNNADEQEHEPKQQPDPIKPVMHEPPTKRETIATEIRDALRRPFFVDVLSHEEPGGSAGHEIAQDHDGHPGVEPG